MSMRSAKKNHFSRVTAPLYLGVRLAALRLGLWLVVRRFGLGLAPCALRLWLRLVDGGLSFVEPGLLAPGACEQTSIGGYVSLQIGVFFSLYRQVSLQVVSILSLYRTKRTGHVKSTRHQYIDKLIQRICKITYSFGNSSRALLIKMPPFRILLTSQLSSRLGMTQI